MIGRSCLWDDSKDYRGTPLPQDPLGLDSDGIAFDCDGTLWVSGEYGPDIVHFAAAGRMLEQLTRGSGLPKALAHWRVDRGTEGIPATPTRRFVVGAMQLAGGSRAARRSRS